MNPTESGSYARKKPVDPGVPAPRRRRRKLCMRPRTVAKRARILEIAMRHFADRGYEAARVEDIASELGISKGSIFQHFKSKEGLFLEVYKKAVAELPAWMEAPEEVRRQGFFAVVRHWLEDTERQLRELWGPTRVAIVATFGTDLLQKRDINRFMAAEDPYGTAAFVEYGIERGEVRDDIDPRLLASFLDWASERFQDALLTEELDPGLFRRDGDRPQGTQALIDQFVKILRGAMGRR